MFSLISKNNKKQQPTISYQEDDDQEEEYPENDCGLKVSSHVYLKPPHTTGTLDKAVVLRRIRRRRRTHKVKSAVESLFSSPFTSKDTIADGDGKKKIGSAARIKWADDAFAAPGKYYV